MVKKQRQQRLKNRNTERMLNNELVNIILTKELCTCDIVLNYIYDNERRELYDYAFTHKNFIEKYVLNIKNITLEKEICETIKMYEIKDFDTLIEHLKKTKKENALKYVYNNSLLFMFHMNK